MMNVNWIKLLQMSVLAAALQMMFLHSALAGGMTIGDLGAHAEGRSGAFAAKADDLSAIEYNPAGLTSIGSTQIYLSNRFGYAVEEFSRQTATAVNGDAIPFDSVSNEHPWQLLDPMIGVASNFGLENWAFAIGAYAPPGIATQHFPEDGGQRFMLIERDVKILYYNLSVAWKFKNLFGLGASLQWVDAASIKLSLIVNGNTSEFNQPDGGNMDMLTTVTGADHFGFSGILGAWVKPLPFLHLALSGRVAPTTIKADCKIAVDVVHDDVINDDDMTITRGGSEVDDVTLSMKLPPMARFGVRYIRMKGKQELFDVELDVTYEAWHVMDRYTLDGEGLEVDIDGDFGSVDPIPIDKIYLNKQWKDTFSVRLGGDYNLLDNHLTLRAGAFFESGSKNDSYAYVDFYASHRVGGSVGATARFFGVDLSLSYAFLYEIPFSVSEEEGKIYQQVPARTVDTPGPVVNAGDYSAHYHFATVSVSYTF